MVQLSLTKNADIGKYEYSGYGIGFHRRSSFLFPGGGFGVDMNFSAHIDNKKKNIVLGRGPTQGLEDTLAAEILLWQRRISV